eukprot:TRINITY_DN8503_c0_g1_i1.p1 TRINITY_DN8503_c0_g1~~TRINITY_DN8503_c0_g1_i1.p1  ORF type:complete len:661 (+),score=257.74 TRINITY_DN8503_c0_g1_i1:186-2168(+)
MCIRDRVVDMAAGLDRCCSEIQHQLNTAIQRAGADPTPAREVSGFVAGVRRAWKAADAASAGLDPKLIAGCQDLGKLACRLIEAAEANNKPGVNPDQGEGEGKLAEASMEAALYKERAEAAEIKLAERDKEHQEAAAQILVLSRTQHLLRQENQMLKAQPKSSGPPQAAPQEETAKAVKEEEAAEPGQPNEAAAKQMLDLQAQLAQSRAEAESRQSQLQELTVSLNSCMVQLKEHQILQLEVSDKDVLQHPEFVSVNITLQRQTQQLKNLGDALERSKWENANLEATHSLQIEKSKIHMMEQQHKSDTEFEKLRAQNSQLLSQVDQLKRQLGSKEAVPDYSSQLEEQQALFDALKAELDRSKEAGKKQAELLAVSEKQAKAALANNKDEVVVELNAKLELKEKEIEDYMEEIDEVAKEYEALRTQNLRLLEQLKSKEEAKTQLIEQKIQAKHVESMLRAQKEELQRKATLMAETKESCLGVQSRLEEQLKIAESKAANLAETEQCLSKLVESHKTFTQDAAVLYNATRAKLEAKTKAFDQLKAQCKNETDQLEETRHENRKLSEKVYSYDKKLSYYNQNSKTSKKVSGSDRELQDLKQMISCSIDETKMLGLDRFVVITKCFHVFSDAGLKRNIANRNRKCPACQLAFDKSDVKTLFIDF